MPALAAFAPNAVRARAAAESDLESLSAATSRIFGFKAAIAMLRLRFEAIRRLRISEGF